MSRELFAGLSGASASWNQLEVLANNVANVNTPGFKGSRVTFESAGPTGHALGQAYALTSATHADTRSGPVEVTGNPMHVAIDGEGWFAVDGGNQGTLLTRNGQLHVDTTGRLVTGDGHPLLGEGGPIDVPEGETLTIAGDGTISGSLSGELDKLLVVQGRAKPLGGTLWKADGPTTRIENPTVRQGALEQSNVDAVATMVELVEASRYFEAYQQVMRTSDELDGRLYRRG